MKRLTTIIENINEAIYVLKELWEELEDNQYVVEEQEYNSILYDNFSTLEAVNRDLEKILKEVK